jgi:hypothetical protein
MTGAWPDDEKMQCNLLLHKRQKVVVSYWLKFACDRSAVAAHPFPTAGLNSATRPLGVVSIPERALDERKALPPNTKLSESWFTKLCCERQI